MTRNPKLQTSYWDDYWILRNDYTTRIQNEEKKITYPEFLDWVQSGAIDQICPDIYVHTDYGLTPVLRMRQWILDHPDAQITMNLHYTSIEHVHLAFTLTEEQLPYFEAPWVGNYLDHFRKVNLYEKCVGPNGTAIAPDFPGVYDIPWLYKE